MSRKKRYATVREAALDLLILANLTAKEGSFAGQIAFDTRPLSERQERWLRVLLERHELPPLAPSAMHYGDAA
jgi:hypothetical protein